MSEPLLYDALLVAWLLAAALILPLLMAVPAPYGRHLRRGWGPPVPSRLGWVVMEAPAPLVVGLLFAVGARRTDPAAVVFLAMWLGHYLYRAFVYPFRRRGSSAPMPLVVVLSGVVFNLVNGYLQGRYLFTLGPERGPGWLADARFVCGLALFAAGLALHLDADARLRRLRAPGESAYAIPHGGLFERVSCPNFLGEIVEWTGWALATFSPAGAAFALWTVANLVPRGLAHHRWYRRTFAEYPLERRAIIPFLL